MAVRTVPPVTNWFAGQKLTATAMNGLATWQNFQANPPMFRMRQSIVQSVPNTAVTQITMDASDWDTDNGRATITPYAYTIPVGMTGRWRFTWGIEWASNAAGARVAILYRNGSPALGDTVDVAANNDFTAEIGTATIAVAAGDVMAVYGYQNSGGALNTMANTQFTSFFEGELRSLASP